MARPARSRAGLLATPILSAIALVATRFSASAADSRPIPDASPRELAEFVVAAIRDNWAKLPPLALSAVQTFRTNPAADYEFLVYVYQGLDVTAAQRHFQGCATYKVGRSFPFQHRYYLGSIDEVRLEVVTADGQFLRSESRTGNSSSSIVANAGGIFWQWIPDAPEDDPRQAGADINNGSLEVCLAPEFCVSASSGPRDKAHDVLKLRFQGEDVPTLIVEFAQDAGWLPVLATRLRHDESPSSTTVVAYQLVNSGRIARTVVHRTYRPGATSDGDDWNMSLETEYTLVREGKVEASVFTNTETLDPIAPLAMVQKAQPAPAKPRIANAQEHIAVGWTLHVFTLIVLGVGLIAVLRRRVKPSHRAPGQVRPRPWRFGLRTLLLLVTAIAIGMGVLANLAHKVRRLVDAVRDAGGQAWLLHEVDAAGNPISDPAPPGPGWLRKRIGVEYFDSVGAVDLESATLTDELFARLAGAKNLVRLSLADTRTDDDRMAQLIGLTNLKHLDVSHTAITDDGLTPVAGYSQLKSLQLSYCNVTSAGLAQLTSLPVEFLSFTARSRNEPHGDLLDRFAALKKVLFSRSTTEESIQDDWICIPVDFTRIEINLDDEAPKRPRRGAFDVLDPSVLAAIANVAPDAPADVYWARGVLLDFLGADRESREESADLLLAAIERSSRPAPVWISLGRSLPPSRVIGEARRTVLANLADHPQAGLLRQWIGVDEPSVACFAAALALEPNNRDAWFAISMSLRRKPLLAALDGWAASDPQNAAPHYLQAALALFSLDGEWLAESLSQGNARPGVQAPSVTMPPIAGAVGLEDSLNQLAEKYDEALSNRVRSRRFDNLKMIDLIKSMAEQLLGEGSTQQPSYYDDMYALAKMHRQGLRVAAASLAIGGAIGRPHFNSFLDLSSKFASIDARFLGRLRSRTAFPPSNFRTTANDKLLGIRNGSSDPFSNDDDPPAPLDISMANMIIRDILGDDQLKDEEARWRSQAIQDDLNDPSR